MPARPVPTSRGRKTSQSAQVKVAAPPRAATHTGSRRTSKRPRGGSLAGAQACRQKFLESFPDGFADETYVAWERGYKWKAHLAWQEALGAKRFRDLLDRGRFDEVAAHAVRIESRTNLLFSFEKMALRDAVRVPAGARAFAQGLHDFLHGRGAPEGRFAAWRDTVAGLPRRKTRVLAWPLLTVFGFIAQPRQHMFLKPMVTRRAARAYGYDFHYSPKPDWRTYQDLLDFADVVRRDNADLGPQDMIDLQSFIWVQGSDEY